MISNSYKIFKVKLFNHFNLKTLYITHRFFFSSMKSSIKKAKPGETQVITCSSELKLANEQG